MSAVRVTHVISPALVGGAERVVLTGATAQAQRGAKVELLLLRERRLTAAADAMAREAGARGRSAVLVNVEGRCDLSALETLRTRLNDCSVVHAHGYKALTFAALTCRAPHRRLFATAHGETSHTSAVCRWEQLERALYALTRRVFAPSLATAGALAARGVDAGRLQVVENPVSLSPLQRAPEPERLVYLGRLSPEKGLEVLLAALARAEGVWLDVVGDGPERARLEAQVSSLRLAGRVHFHGLQRDVGPFLARAGALVLPSWREGLPVALLEARGAGVPVLASRVGGVPALVRDGVDGLLLAPGDVEGWVQALTTYRASAGAMTAAAAARAATVVAHFSPQRWADDTLAAYLDAPKGDA